MPFGQAILIARFCARQKPGLWQPAAPELRQLQALVRCVEALEEMKQMEMNRLDAGVVCEVVRASLRDHILYLESHIEDARREIQGHIGAHPELARQSKLLQSIPGIGQVTAAVLLAEVGDIRTCAARTQKRKQRAQTNAPSTSRQSPRSGGTR